MLRVRSRRRAVRHMLLALAGVAVVAAALVPAQPAAAYDYYVPCGDIDTLNWGIINTNAQVGDVVHVILAAGCTYTITSAYDPVEGNGLPEFTGAGGATLVIDGNGATIERDSSAAPFRFLEIATGAVAEINDVTFLRGQGREGNSGANGGAILNGGTLTVNDSSFYLNQAGTGWNGADYDPPSSFNGGNGGNGGSGGAIANQRNLTVNRSDFFLNSAGGAGSGGDGQDNGGNGGQGGFGGAIYSSNNASLTIADSVIRNNGPGGGGAPGASLWGAGPSESWGAVGKGGGIASFAAPTTISGTLFSENDAGASYGGAIYYGGFTSSGTAMSVSNSTFLENSAQAGGAIYNDGRTAELANLTFSGNTSEASSIGERPDFGADVLYTPAGSPRADMRNLLMVGNGVAADCKGGAINSSFWNFGGLLAVTGDSSCGADLFTGASQHSSLASNGGPTETLALLSGSAAIDAGVSSGCPATDQRGLPRPQRGGCDIGAFELAALPVLSVDDPQGVPVGVARPFSLTTSYSRPLVYTWSVSGVAATISGGSTATPTITFAAQGTATVTVTVHDVLADTSLETASAQRTVLVSPATNTGPTLTIGTSARTVDEGTTVAFPFTANDAQGNTVSYATGFPDCGSGGVLSGTPAVSASGGTFSCSFASGPASSSVRVQLADSFGARSSLATIPVTVADMLPVITITGDATPDENSTVTYSYTVVDPDPGDAAIGAVATLCESTDLPGASFFRFHKVAGSDTQTGSGTSIAGTFDCWFQNGPEAGVARVSVPGSTRDLVLAVQNVAPTLSLSGPTTVRERETGVTYDFPYVAADVSDGVSYAWEDASCGALGNLVMIFGDRLVCDFPGGPGSSTVSFTVTDSNGATATDSVVVTVTGIPPLAMDALPQTSLTTPEGGTLWFDVGAQYPRDPTLVDFSVPAGCSLSPEADWFVFVGEWRVAPFSCAFPDGGGSVVKTVTASNPYGTLTKDLTVTVTDVAPTITATVAPDLLLAGDSVALALGSITDPGTDTVTGWAIDWGDGSTTSGSGSPPSSVDHVYTVEGDYDLAIALTDEDGTHADAGPVLEVVVETAPVFTAVPGDSTVEATSAAGADVPYAVTAADVRDGAITPVCTRAPVSPGTEFPLGLTAVDCVAADSAGFSALTSFTVTVVDTTGPVLSTLPSLAARAPDARGRTVAFDATAVDAVDGPAAVLCAPASGSLFPVGSTVVTCTAADTRANATTASFRVVIAPPPAPATEEEPVPSSAPEPTPAPDDPAVAPTALPTPAPAADPGGSGTVPTTAFVLLPLGLLGLVIAVLVAGWAVFLRRR